MLGKKTCRSATLLTQMPQRLPWSCTQLCDEKPVINSLSYGMIHESMSMGLSPSEKRIDAQLAKKFRLFYGS
jgi:hypothetical protein